MLADLYATLRSSRSVAPAADPEEMRAALRSLTVIERRPSSNRGPAFADGWDAAHARFRAFTSALLAEEESEPTGRDLGALVVSTLEALAESPDVPPPASRGAISAYRRLALVAGRAFGRHLETDEAERWAARWSARNGITYVELLDDAAVLDGSARLVADGDPGCFLFFVTDHVRSEVAPLGGSPLPPRGITDALVAATRKLTPEVERLNLLAAGWAHAAGMTYVGTELAALRLRTKEGTAWLARNGDVRSLHYLNGDRDQRVYGGTLAELSAFLEAEAVRLGVVVPALEI